MSSFVDYYKILDSTPNSTQDEIRKNYRTLVLKYHPDRNGNNSQNEEMLKLVNLAYEILSNPVGRSEYDKEYILFYTKKAQGRSINKTNNNLLDLFWSYVRPYSVLIFIILFTIIFQLIEGGYKGDFLKNTFSISLGIFLGALFIEIISVIITSRELSLKYYSVWALGIGMLLLNDYLKTSLFFYLIVLSVISYFFVRKIKIINMNVAKWIRISLITLSIIYIYLAITAPFEYYRNEIYINLLRNENGIEQKYALILGWIASLYLIVICIKYRKYLLTTVKWIYAKL